MGRMPASHGSRGSAEVTVGVPVYNNAGTLRRTVESILAQTRPAERILLSDDQSKDNSQQVGEALAAEYPTVTYVRRPKNIGQTMNFHALVHAATTPYFMWLAGDDLILPTYLERTAARLDADPGVVGCVSQVQFTVDGVPSRLATGGQPLDGPPTHAIARYLDEPGDSARLYGLFRRDTLAATFPTTHFHAWDWASMAATLLHGRHERVEEVLMVRDETPSAYYTTLIRRDNPRTFDRIFPLDDFEWAGPDGD